MRDLLFLGDSITDCYHAFDTDNLGEGYVRMIAEKLGYGFGKVKVRNKGIDGFTLPALLCMWERECTELTPDGINILIGINDVGVIKNTGLEEFTAVEDFKLGFETLIEKIRRTCDCPITVMEPFLFACPAEYESWRGTLSQIQQVLKDMTERYGLIWIPLQEDLDRVVEVEGFDAVTIDGLHLTTKGHRILAEKWLAQAV